MFYQSVLIITRNWVYINHILVTIYLFLIKKTFIYLILFWVVLNSKLSKLFPCPHFKIDLVTWIWSYKCDNLYSKNLKRKFHTYNSLTSVIENFPTSNFIICNILSLQVKIHIHALVLYTVQSIWLDLAAAWRP